ncbi:type VII secretion protein EccB [Corynebacterium aquatimens]|uniref:type VII secretion protein EccB n=2 Tax=Corynebacterium TaxID=1716 RepID=UPI001F23182B|nr:MULTISPECIES: type VII secretion protein EccB [Corynebacterium]
MRRRVEHGLIFGDVRMIHDPLATRRRAMVFGMVAVVMVAAVMGLFAWMRPNPDPLDAPILRASDGELYVRVDDVVHPVTNLTSARLVAGTDAEPQRIGDEALSKTIRGVPVGIVSAPSLFAPGHGTELIPPDADTWSVCTAESEVVVRAGAAPEAIVEKQAVLATADGRDWVVTAEGRTELPGSDSASGRILRRALHIDTRTPRWAPPAQVLAAIPELPPYTFPSPLPEVLLTDTGAWALDAVGGIKEVTPFQGQLLIDAGSPATEVPRPGLAAFADATDQAELRLPQRSPEWIDPDEAAICAVGGAAAATWSIAEALEGSAELSGDAVATRFVGPAAGAVAVDTGRGLHVVGAAGLRHAVPERETLEMIGAHRTDDVPWAILKLLPEGAELTRRAALAALY